MKASNPTVNIISLGCAKNLVNSEQMLARLVGAGFAVSEEARGADICLINTCGFIDAAKREAIDEILKAGQLKARGKLSKIIVAGCLAERYKDDILAEMPEVDAVIGVGAFDEIVSVAQSVLNGETVVTDAKPERADDDAPRLVTTPKAWAYLKIADGCDNRCAFCVIPSIRGRYRSRKIESVLAEAENLVAGGARELILIAQDTTRYGVDLYKERRLAELLRKLSRIEDLKWIRVHYMYPDEIDSALIDEFAVNPKLLPYFDIPLQHINAKILKTMRRRGTPEEYKRTIAEIRRKVPGAVMRTSLIAGLPGETETEFEELAEFLRQYRIERAGVFVYSPEEGTDAALMDRCDEETAARRAEILERVQSEVLESYARSLIGKEFDALIESDNGGGTYSARSYAESPDIDGYITVTSDSVLQVGEFYRIIIEHIENAVPCGKVI